MMIKTSQMCSSRPRRWDWRMMSPSPPDLAAELHQLGEHDVAEGEPEEQPQRVEDRRHGEGHEHLR